MESTDVQNFEHLEELRRRIIKISFMFILSFVAALIFVQDIYHWLVRDLDGKLAILGPSDILWVYMIISSVFAIAVTIPVAAYQTWLFVKPALTKEESRITLSFIPGLFILFIAGISFGYFVLFPTVLGFLTNLSAGQFELMFTADKYFRFMLHLSLPFGFLFEMPLVVMFLTRLGILNPMKLAKARKISYFVLIIISILITPPDFISDILVIVPLLLLYELSVTISRFVYKKKIASDASM
ncbi:twin-arginine translocase subunit TatC [Metabacillus arenae]|uniref:Sec-independent protein translocase protein TatC n=1 Tax=Metabacillus arenae TaxID=2771434 RepID=A0A926NSX4_9BACI|nr:twin-arginine translocase subunit TatC [Metabacillus arenae]MBD1383352.1 twin-arginine translocase subunit TatC [Metabacillus arenae]